MKLVKQIIPLLLLILIVFACNQESKENRKAREARENLASKLSRKYDISRTGQCVVSFRTEGERSDVLVASPCSIMRNKRLVISDLVTELAKENRKEMKKVGFKRIVIYNNGSESSMTID